jgi:hypothetical protein
MFGVDPSTGQETRLFDPRVEEWTAAFEVTPTCEILGRTPSARATIELLQLNRAVAVAIRVEERRRTRWP